MVNKKKCCNNCPFLKDTLKGWLGKEKTREIVNAIKNDKTFHCHKTLDGNEKICAGSLILLDKEQDIKSNFTIRLAIMTKQFAEIPKSEYGKVFDTAKEFIDYHTK